MEKFWKEKYLRYIGIILLSFIMNYVHHRDADLIFALPYLSISLTITFIMWEGNRIILFYFRKKLPQFKQTTTRLLWTAAVLITYTLFADYIVHQVMAVIRNETYVMAESIGKFASKFIATGCVVVIYESAYFFQRWQETIVEKESLKHQQVRSQFATLKNQISPHFLFNSLNTLVTLIAENQELAIEFTQKLSEVYRYILQNKEKEVITLEKELDSANAYIFLLKMRFADNLQVEIDIEDQYLNRYIPPLCLQMLLENAIKHNEVSTAKPLSIYISVENEDTLVVKNKLQRKRMVEYSTKTGLENIRKRYQHLSDREVDVIITTSNFIVTLPLLKISKEASLLSRVS